MYISIILLVSKVLYSTKNHKHTHLILAENSLEIFPKHKGCFFISE